MINGAPFPSESPARVYARPGPQGERVVLIQSLRTGQEVSLTPAEWKLFLKYAKDGTLDHVLED